MQSILEQSKPYILYLQAHPYFHYVLIIVFLFFMLRLSRSARKNKKSSTHLSSEDFQAIAGENIGSTQLDLAKAYLEMGQPKEAKKVLKEVIKLGDKTNRNTAKQLLKSC